MVSEYSICDFTKNPQSHKIPALGVVPSQRDSQVEDLELLKIKVWLWFTELLAWKPCDWHHMRRGRRRLAEACVRVCLWTQRLFHCCHCSITAVISFLGFHWQKADKGCSRGTGTFSAQANRFSAKNYGASHSVWWCGEQRPLNTGNTGLYVTFKKINNCKLVQTVEICHIPEYKLV